MVVIAELPFHNKFRRLKKIVGEGAMEYLILIWAHCENNKRGEFWPGVDASYVEDLCGWDGQAGLLFQSLCQCGTPKVGFIVPEAGGVRIHDWETHNSWRVKNWSRNPNGRKGKTPEETRSEAATNPAVQGQNGASLLTLANGQNQEASAYPNGSGRVTPQRSRNEPASHIISTHIISSVEDALASPETGQFHALAQGRIDLLNSLVPGADFRPTIYELDQVTACLLLTDRGRGVDVAGVDRMLRRQAALWLNQPRMRSHLTPRTLFGANFNEYYGARDVNVAGDAPDHRGLEQFTAEELANYKKTTRPNA